MRTFTFKQHLGRRVFFCVMVLCAVVVLPGTARSANHYIRSGASGDGSDWNNARANLPGSLVRGDTYYIADGSYGAYTFDDPVSGSTYIYIKKATVNDHGTNTGWNNSYGDGTADFSKFSITTSYLDIDGQTGGGPGSWDSGHGFYVTPSSCGSQTKIISIYSQNTTYHHINLKHIEAEHCGENTGDDSHDVVYLIGPGGNPHHHITFSHCWFHYTNRTHFLIRHARYITIEYNLISERYNNTGVHGEAVSWDNYGTPCYSDIRYNRFKNIKGTGVLVWSLGSGNNSHMDIYGNVFYTDNPGRYTCSNSVIANTNTGVITNFNIHNNTFANIASNYPIAFKAGSNNNYAYNNAVYGYDGLVWSSRAVCDYNVRINCTGGISNAGPHDQTISSNILVDSGSYNFRLSQPTNAGKSDIDSEFAFDMDGSPRGGDGSWDRGAFEYGSGGTPPPTTTTTVVEEVSPPTGLQIISVD